MTKKHNPLFLKSSEAARSQIRELTIDDVKTVIDRGGPIELLDVREDHEWIKGHLPMAEHLGRGILERDIEKKLPDLATEIVVYCGGGFRSALAAESLGRMGYHNVYSMAGGYSAWLARGFPVTKD